MLALRALNAGAKATATNHAATATTPSVLINNTAPAPAATELTHNEGTHITSTLNYSTLNISTLNNSTRCCSQKRMLVFKATQYFHALFLKIFLTIYHF